MKTKIILIFYCLFTIISFGQNKIVNKQKHGSTSVQKQVLSKSTVCGLCKGTGKDPGCNGTGLCQNHSIYKYLDKECYRNCDCDEEESAEDCTARCKNYCEKSTPCNTCDSYDGTCKKMWCNNGVCRNCNGKGKLTK